MDAICNTHRQRHLGACGVKLEPRFKRDGVSVWIEAGYAILVQDGHRGLTIERLTKATCKTRGSFYHHFGSIDGFISHILKDWREQNTERIVRLAAPDPDPNHRRAVVNGEALRLDARIETAIRRWAGADDQVLNACKLVDDRRIDVLINDLVAMTKASGKELSLVEARLLAQFEYSAFVGAQILAPEGRLDTLHEIGLIYEKMLYAYLEHR